MRGLSRFLCSHRLHLLQPTKHTPSGAAAGAAGAAAAAAVADPGAAGAGKQPLQIFYFLFLINNFHTSRLMPTYTD